MLDRQDSLVELSVVVLIDSFACILRSLVDYCRRAQELPELVPVELALLQLANLLEQSL